MSRLVHCDSIQIASKVSNSADVCMFVYGRDGFDFQLPLEQIIDPYVDLSSLIAFSAPIRVNWTAGTITTVVMYVSYEVLVVSLSLMFLPYHRPLLLLTFFLLSHFSVNCYFSSAMNFITFIMRMHIIALIFKGCFYFI